MHVADGVDDRAWIGVARHASHIHVGCGGGLGESEIENLDTVRVGARRTGHEDGVRLQIAMQQTGGVSRRETVGNLNGEIEQPAHVVCAVGAHELRRPAEELTELRRLLTGSRLLSLTGAGGVGKTRLAVRLVSELVPEVSNAVWLIDLAPLTAPDLIPQTIVTAVGVRESAQRSVREALVRFLRHREMLLVLDTCEHLIDACAELVDPLLREAPGLRVVATSREAFRVGEVRSQPYVSPWPYPPFPAP